MVARLQCQSRNRQRARSVPRGAARRLPVAKRVPRARAERSGGSRRARGQRKGQWVKLPRMPMLTSRHHMLPRCRRQRCRHERTYRHCRHRHRSHRRITLNRRQTQRLPSLPLRRPRRHPRRHPRQHPQSPHFFLSPLRCGGWGRMGWRCWGRCRAPWGRRTTNGHSHADGARLHQTLSRSHIRHRSSSTGFGLAHHPRRHLHHHPAAEWTAPRLHRASRRRRLSPRVVNRPQ